MTAVSTNNMEEIRRRISLLQWDLQNISNEELRKRKENELFRLRSELDTLRSADLS